MAATAPEIFDWTSLHKDYEKYVKNNVETITRIEGGIRSLSYVIAGFMGESEVLSELLYSAASLLQLMNDTILKQARNIIPKVPISVKKLQSVLTAIEYVEVLVELSADRFSTRVKWSIIALIEIFRISVRIILLVKYKAGVQSCPPIMPMNRGTAGATMDIELGNMSAGDSTTTLKRSGRMIRTLDSSASSAGHRPWEFPGSSSAYGRQGNGNRGDDETPTRLNARQQLSETLHIIRPVIHLLSMYRYGLQSWKPWLLACGVDISSLLLMKNSRDLNQSEQSEMRRRTLVMMFYLLRSPFYDRYSKTKIVIILNLMADIIPGFSFLVKPLLNYLPVWQRVYFYTWAQ